MSKPLKLGRQDFDWGEHLKNLVNISTQPEADIDGSGDVSPEEARIFIDRDGDGNVDAKELLGVLDIDGDGDADILDGTIGIRGKVKDFKEYQKIAASHIVLIGSGEEIFGSLEDAVNTSPVDLTKLKAFLGDGFSEPSTPNEETADALAAYLLELLQNEDRDEVKTRSEGDWVKRERSLTESEEASYKEKFLDAALDLAPLGREGFFDRLASHINIFADAQDTFASENEYWINDTLTHMKLVLQGLYADVMDTKETLLEDQ